MLTIKLILQAISIVAMSAWKMAKAIIEIIIAI